MTEVRDVLAASLRASFRNITGEADEWRPLADFILARERLQREQWIDYVEWLVAASGSAYAMAWVHGHRDSDELIEEGKRRRAALGYEPRWAPRNDGSGSRSNDKDP